MEENKNSISFSSNFIRKEFNLTEEYLDYYESLTLVSDKRDFNNAVTKQIEHFLTIIGNQEITNYFGFAIKFQNGSKDFIKSIFDYNYYLKKSLLLIYLDVFAIDKAFSIWKQLICFNESSLAANEEEKTSLIEPLISLSKKLLNIDKITEAHEVYEDIEKRYLIAKAIKLGYDIPFEEITNIINENKKTVFVINHQTQLENLKQLKYISEKREKKVIIRLLKVKNKQIKLEKLVESYALYPGFIKNIPFEKIIFEKATLKYIPEPSFIGHNEYYFENLTQDQKIEYHKAFSTHTTRRLVTKYKYIRLCSILRAIIFYPALLKYAEVVSECNLLSSIETRTTGQVDNNLAVIKFYDHLLEFDTETRTEVLNCLKILHNNFDTILGMPDDPEFPDFPSMKSFKSLGICQELRCKSVYIPAKGNCLLHRFCIIPSWSYLKDATLPIEELKKYSRLYNP